VYSAFYRLRLVSSSSSASSCLALLLLVPLSSKAITLFSSRVAAALVSPSLLSETHSRREFGATIFFFSFFFFLFAFQSQASPEGDERFFSLTVEE
jgi:hypothetical protein